MPKITLSLWDTGGQERFDFFKTDFFRGIAAVGLVFDVSRPDTFDKIDDFFNELREHSGNIPIFLVGNKNDLKRSIGEAIPREKIIQMAEAFGVTTIVTDEPIDEKAPPTLGNLAVQKGIPVILEELIDGRWISEPSTSAGINGILNIMKSFNMIDGELKPQKDFPIVHGVNKFYGIIRASRGGLIRLYKAPGELIRKGDIIAEIYDLYGDTIDEVKMPIEGYVWAFPCGQSLGTSGGLQAVQSGANVAYAFIHEKDWPP